MTGTRPVFKLSPVALFESVEQGAMGARAGKALLDDPRAPISEKDAETRNQLDSIALSSAIYAADETRTYRTVAQQQRTDETAHRAALIALHSPTTYAAKSHLVSVHMIDDAPVRARYLEHVERDLLDMVAEDGYGLVTRPRHGWRLQAAREYLPPRSLRVEVPNWVPSQAWGLLDEPTDAMRASGHPIEHVVWAGVRPLIDTPPPYPTPLPDPLGR